MLYSLERNPVFVLIVFTLQRWREVCTHSLERILVFALIVYLRALARNGYGVFAVILDQLYER